MAFNPRQYVKNVGKSFGYSVIDSLKTYNPQIASLADGAKEFSSDLKDSIDEMKSNRRNSDPNAEKSLFGIKKSTVTNIRDNLIDDLKTGNWYNKEREDKAGMEMAESMMGFSFDDFDMDFDDFDDEDMFEDDDVNEPVSAADAPAIAAQARSAEAIIDSMDMVGSKSATAISNATVQSADYVVAAVGEGNRALYSLEQRGFMQVSQGLAAINDNIQVIGTIAEPLTKHMQNSATFYTQSAEYQKSVLEKLDVIIKNTTVEETKSSSTRAKTMSDFMSGDSFDLFGYLDFVKDNAKNKAKDSVGMLDMFGGDINGLINYFFASPMKTLTDTMTKVLIPQVTKDAMEEFNKTVSSFIPTMLDSLQHGSIGGSLGSLLESVSDILFPSDRLKTTLNTGQYNKGKVNWTGESEMALKEVIPTYLSAITSALTGNPMTVYDYRSGSFVVKSNVEKSFQVQKQQAANRAGGDFRRDIENSISNSNLKPEQKQSLLAQLDTFLMSAFNKGGYTVGEFRRGERSASDFGVTEDFGNFLMEVFRTYERNNKRGTAMSVSSGIREGRDSWNNQMNRMEEENGIERSLFNNSSALLSNRTTGNELLGVDQYGHDVFFYLQDLWKTNWFLADNIAFFGSNNGGGRGRNKKGNKFANYSGTNASKVNPMRDLRNANERDKENISNIKSGPEPNSSNNSLSENEQQEFINQLADAISGNNHKSKGEKSLEEKNRQREEERERLKALNTMTDAQIEEQLIADFGENKESKSVAGAVDNITGGAFSKIKERVNNILATPGKIVADILNAGQKSLYDLIFGKEDENGEKQGGLFHYFYTQADNLFSHFNEFFNQKAKATMSQWMDWLVNGSLEDLRDDVVNNFKSAGRWVTGKISNFLGFGKKGNKGEGKTEPIQMETPAPENDFAGIQLNARGRRVTKTGVVAVSEGELIIPSEYNPFYHGTNNKSTQLRNERNAARQFYGNFAEGGTVGKDEENRGFAKLLDDSIAKLGEGFGRFFDALFPKDEKEQEDETNKLFSLHTAKALKEANLSDEMHKNSGAMLTGGAIGAGVSILSGCLVGPIAGAAIGAGVGLIAKSDSLQKALFGDVELDKDGNAIGRTGNILSKDMSDFITQKLPNAAVATGVGAAAGLFMGSPILGAFLGGTISFAAQSETVRKTLFGEMDEEGNRQGGLISKELQDKLKKAAPNMGAGALGGLLATALGGPFGLAGNLVVGTAIGYASTSEKFQEAVLGKVGEDGKRTGGIVGEFRGYFFGYTDDTGKQRQGIIQSVVGIFDKVGDEIRVRARDIFKDTAQNLRGAIDRAASSTLGQWFGGTRLGRAVGGVARTARKAINAPFRFIQNRAEDIDVALGRRALRQGRNLRNANGQKMTSEERAQWAKEHGMESYADSEQGAIDQMLAGLSSQEDIDALNEQLAMIEDPRAQTDKNQKRESTKFAYMLDDMGIDSKTATDLNHLAVGDSNRRLRKGGITDLDSFFNAHPEINDEQRERITNEFNKVQDTVKAGSNAQEQADAARAALAERLGIDEKYITRDTVRNIQDREQAEIDRNKPKTEEEKTDSDKALDKGDEIKDSIVELKDEAKSKLDEVTEKICNTIKFVFGKNPDGSSILTGEEGTGSTKICPQCGAELPADATECDECGYKFPSTGNNELNKIINAPKTSDIINPGAHAAESEEEEKSEQPEEEEKTRTEIGDDGSIRQYVKNNQGEWVLDTSDKETIESEKNSASMREAFMSLPLIGPALGGLSNAFGKLFGNDENGSGEGGGLLSGLFDKFFGNSSFLGGIFNTISKFFGGSGITKLGSGIVNTVKTIAPAAALGAVLVGALGGKFDDLIAKLTNNSMANNKTKVAKGEDGETHQLAKDEDGNYITDEDGNYIATDGTVIDKDAYLKDVGSDTSLSTQLGKNLATGAVMGTGSALTKGASWIINRVTKGTGTAKIAEKATEAAGKVLNTVATSEMGATVLESIATGLSKIPDILKSIPFIKNTKLAQNADTLIQGIFDLASNGVSSATSSTLQSLASGLSNALLVLKVATVVIAAWNGYGEAEIYFNVKEATLGEKIISGVVAAINAVIPIVGNLIPTKTIIQFFIDHADIFGIDMSSTKERQEALQQEVDEYNAEHGTEYTSEQYLEEVDKKGGIVRKVKNTATSILNSAKNGVKKIFGIGSNDEEEEVSETEEVIYDNGTNASGNLYTMPGVASVSEGELIVSAKDNPVGGSSAVSGILGKALEMPRNLSPFDEANVRETLSSHGVPEDKIDKVVSKINNLNSSATNLGNDIKGIISNSITEDGGISIGSVISNTADLFTGKMSESDNKIISTIGNVASGVKNTATGIFGTIGDAVNASTDEDGNTSIVKFASNLFNSFKGNSNSDDTLESEEDIKEQNEELEDEYEEYEKAIDKIQKAVKDGNFEELLDVEYKGDEDSPMSGLFSGMFNIQKLYNAAYSLIAQPFEGSGSGTNSSNSNNSSSSSSATENVEESSGGWLSKIGNAFKNFFFGSGSGLSSYSGGASGNDEDETFVSQDDNRYRSIRYANGTIEDMGCGPASATMLINYSNPGSISMRDAIKYGGKYQTDDGTSADYFPDILSSYGMSADYINGGDTRAPREMMNLLSNGRPMVLLGRDSSNSSKKDSPFGPMNHYVVATGLDSKGNVIINDPENSHPERYNSRILDDVSMGIATDPTNRDDTDAEDIAAFGGAGFTVPDTAYSQAVWGYLTSRGYGPAAAAGILGNMYQESAVDPTAIQKGGKGPAAGIVQWENWKTNSDRWAQMNKYAQSQGKDWTDLDSQLKFMDAEFTGELKDQIDSETWRASDVKKRYGSIEGFKNLTDVDEATLGFEQIFEGANPEKADMDTRYEAAKQYYNLYSGSSYTGNYSNNFSAVGNPNFTKYNLTDAEILQLANLATQEQGTTKGAAAEASLMANIWERDKGNTKYKSLMDYVRNSGWWYNAAKYMDTGPASGTTSDANINAVREVIVNGKRTIPGYVDEHDCWSDIKSATNNGQEINPISERSQYQKDTTKIENNMGGAYTFYSFPDTNSDPFGYTDASKSRSGVEEGYYNLDGSIAVGSTTGGTTSSNSGVGGILDIIKNAFKSAFAPILGGDTGDSSSTYSSGTSSTGANSENVYTGLGSIDGTPEQQALVQTMDSKRGQLNYSQQQRDPEKGSADCSSTVNWAYKKVMGKSIGDNTEAQLVSDTTDWVDMATSGLGGYYDYVSASSGPNISNLAPGDIMLYSRSGNGGRPYRVGHVEMYAGNNQRLGHGGPNWEDVGPKLTEATKDSDRYIGSKRLKEFLNTTNTSNESANTATNENEEINEEVAEESGGRSGLGNVHMPSVSKINMPSHSNRNRLRGYSGGATGSNQTEGLQRATATQSTTDQSLIVSLLRAIARATQAIADNTTDIPTLGTTLTNYCKSQLSTSITEANAAAQTAANNANSNKVNPEDDPALQELMYTMGEIAKG